MPRPLFFSRPTALAAAALAAGSLAGGTAGADEWTSGHGDIGIEYDAAAGEFELHYHLEGGTVGGVSRPDEEFEPDELTVRVPDVAGQNFDSVPNGFEFIGITPDGDSGTSDFWSLPSTDQGDRPYIGFATEEGFSGSDFTDIVLSLTGFSGPGEFAMWVSGINGPTALFATSDGVSAADAFSIPEGTHNHYDMGFTALGDYAIELTATGTLAGGGTVTDTATFNFAVGDPAAVPEPGSMALIGLAACGLAGRTVRRRRKDAAAA